MSKDVKPIELFEFVEALTDVSVGQIEAVKAELINSLNRLIDTNLELTDELGKVSSHLEDLPAEASHDDLKDDFLLYLDTIKENILVITQQSRRLNAANTELVRRGALSIEAKENHESVVNKKIKLMHDYFKKETKAGIWDSSSHHTNSDVEREQSDTSLSGDIYL
ncbi:translation machinery-associated protein 17 [Diutina catenulata]